jgi:hypothetical protein
MVRRVFFSFHYERDIWRVNQVRKSWLTKADRESAGYWDASLWEEAKLKGKNALKKLIDEGLENTSVTVILIGNETADREWVIYEIQESVKRGNGLLGVYIHNLKNQYGQNDLRGINPFDRLVFSNNQRSLSEFYYTYDWLSDDGYLNFSNWVENAAQRAGR